MKKSVYIVSAQSCLDLDEIFHYDKENMHLSITKRMTLSRKFTRYFSTT